MRTAFHALVLASLLAAGCSYRLTLGEVPAGDPRVLIQAGKTTGEEVKRSFGPPDLTGTDEEGRPTWTWTRLAVDLSSGKPSILADFFRLTVTFSDGVVKTYSFDRKVKEE